MKPLDQTAAAPKKAPAWTPRRTVIFVIALAMALFHIYTAGIRPLPGVQQRAVHLAFFLALTFLMFPFRSNGDQTQHIKIAHESRRLSFTDFGLVALSSFVGIYVFVEYEALSFRTVMP